MLGEMTEEQPEVDERHDSIVVEGDDEDHVFPPQELDPFTPEPAPPAKARRAMVTALVVVVIVLAVVIWLAATH
jgi:hypothetical protein